MDDKTRVFGTTIKKGWMLKRGAKVNITIRDSPQTCIQCPISISNYFYFQFPL